MRKQREIGSYMLLCRLLRRNFNLYSEKLMLIHAGSSDSLDLPSIVNVLVRAGGKKLPKSSEKVFICEHFKNRHRFEIELAQERARGCLYLHRVINASRMETWGRV